jgi:hypothetical protein
MTSNAAYDGGAVYSDDESNVAATGCYFSFNSADNLGGAVCFGINLASGVLAECQLWDNSALVRYERWFVVVSLLIRIALILLRLYCSPAGPWQWRMEVTATYRRHISRITARRCVCSLRL